ncbi:hypothetical protein TSA6c_16900 [Azospirillum sp. TSA6c]|uniref:hypothetical protein n=1 Tax=Azospirillum sp. TSA6c TaxID=709813 RepID=UPI000D6192B5|nr:hypothetical protein [Azospirillum sp. TSA6c]PWC48115.1 hypothetical protein TSA6c_16900 [Azospirillum sp. TSA6c]
MMKEAIGQFGGRVRKPLRTGIGVLCIGTEITAEQAAKWPTQNRMAMARTEHVFWYPAPFQSEAPTEGTGPADSGAQPETATATVALGAGMEPAVTSVTSAEKADGDTSPTAPTASSTTATKGAGPAGTAEQTEPPPSGQPASPPAGPGLPTIDPETAERDELRAWLIKAGDEPAPALGTDKLRQRVRDKLALSSGGSNQEG